MTSKRDASVTARYLRAAVFGFAAALLAGCAALPDDAPAVEQLDAETGVTIARLGHPIELYPAIPLPGTNGRFAFLGPFETNLMGKREMYLQVALPLEENSTATQPLITVDGVTLQLAEAGRSAEFAGLRKSPYKIPTPWIAMFYFRADADVITRLGAARDLDVQVSETTGRGTVQTHYIAQITDDPRLREFAGRYAH